MSNIQMGEIIAKKRKSLGYTQAILAERLNVSFQAVSKWENNAAYPDVELLPELAAVLHTTVDALMNYSAASLTDYEQRYENEGYYWGIQPNRLCYEIMKLKSPTKPWKVLDIGCGEGKDAVFLARNGYSVTAFDAAESGLEKASQLADKNGVHIDLFKADINDYRLKQDFDIVFSSGVFHYLKPECRKDFIENLKIHTTVGGINVINVFVHKPFVPPAPDGERAEFKTDKWVSGELFTHYYDWQFHEMNEIIFDCNSSGIPHKHCMDIMIAEKK